MYFKVTDVMTLALRLCRRTSPWQRRGFPPTTSIKGFPSRTHPRAHFVDSRGSLAGISVRFYSQDVDPRDEWLAPANPNPYRKPYPFTDRLSRCGSPSDVLDLTRHHSPAPSPQEISNCLAHMWAVTKKIPGEPQRRELEILFDDPALEWLLQNAMRSVDRMSHKDLAYSLISMVRLGVPQHSRVVQTFLRACQERLNCFDEKSLSIMASCLYHMPDDTPNVAALKQGMSLLVEARLPKIKSVLLLQTMMYLIGEEGPLALKRKLEQKALSLTGQVTFVQAQHMFSTMATMGLSSKPLLDICSKKIRENPYGIPFNRLFRILLSCKKLHYRNVNLFTSISDHLVSTLDLWTTRESVLFLSLFEELGFYHAALMEAFAERVIADPDALTLRELLCVVKVYATLNYDAQHHRQQFLDSLSQALDAYLPKLSNFELLRTAYYLCQLGHFPPAHLEKLLQSDTLEHFETTLPKFVPNQERMFRLVNLCLRLDRPPLPAHLTVPSSLLGQPAAGWPPANPCLLESLRRASGERADATLQEAVTVEDSYVIDAVITKPLPSQTAGAEASRHPGEASSPAESSQRIAVIGAQSTSFCLGTSKPRGIMAVTARHLKILGYEPVLVMVQELLAMSEEQRTEFFRERIFPEHHRSDTQPKTEAAESLGTDVSV